MNTIDSLYRYYKKVGPTSFEAFIEEHPELSSAAEKVKDMDNNYNEAVA